MILYYTPGACSQAPHILLHEIGLDHDARRVDLKAKKLEDGGDYLSINPKGAVPALELDSGDVLTENAVILQYLGDRSSVAEVLPPLGQFRRYRVLELVNYITTELHKRFGFLFGNASDETKSFVTEQLTHKLDWIDQRLGKGPFLMEEGLTLPDPYLFVITGWTEKMLGGIDRWPNLAAFRRRMLERDSVRNVLRFEGLLEEEPAG
jgi:glutathione S-transferase